MPDSFSLIAYDAACAAVAEARRVDELKDILDIAAAMKEYARRARNRQMEEDAAEIRVRATRKLGELIKAQKESVGLNTGAAGGGEKDGPRGLLKNPRDNRPTLASQGINKNLAHQARVLVAMSEEEFTEAIVEARATASRSMRRVVNAAAIEQERKAYRARTHQGGTVADLHSLAASGQRFGVVYADPAWKFLTYSGKGGSGKAQSVPSGARVLRVA
jgi:hypothetical protein